MGDVKWIKICTDIFDDEKVLLIESMPDADGIIVIWFKLLCMAGKQNNSGVFMLNDKIAYTDEMLATVFRRPINTVRLALQTFANLEMIEIVDDVITIPNWEKHQSIDKLEKLKEQNRLRVAAHRAKQRSLIGNNDCNATSNGDCNITVQKCNATDIDKEKEIEKDINNNIIDEFETLWKMYPNKKGKDKALGYYKKARKSGTTFEDVEQGIKNYCKEIEIKKTSKQYIQHGSTWFNNKGWLDDYELTEEKGATNNEIITRVDADGKFEGWQPKGLYI